MTTDTRSPHEIERDIERDRAELTDNLETLQDRFSIDGVMRSVGDHLREHGSDIGGSLTRTVKENPAAVALTGIGLAWMIFGNKPGQQAASRPSSDHRSSDYQGYAQRNNQPLRPAISRPDPRLKSGQAGLPSWALTEDEYDDGPASRVADVAKSARATIGDVASSTRDSLSDAASSARKGVSDATSAAQDSVARAGSAVSSKASRTGEAVSDAASGASRSASDIASSARQHAARMKERLAEGTETLSEEAKARVIAAREAAVEARRRAAEAAATGAERASDLYDNQPLVAGALAVAIGAAIGGALPRTQKEDDLMGGTSDELMQQAERIFYEEREKAKAVIAAAKDEAKTVAKEKRDDLNRGAPGEKSAVEAVADEAKAAGKRVVDAAEAKAGEKDLGKIKS